jgi:hypothetical protein
VGAAGRGGSNSRVSGKLKSMSSNHSTAIGEGDQELEKRLVQEELVLELT